MERLANRMKTMKSGLLFLLVGLCAFPLFQNCDLQKQGLNGEVIQMALPTDVKSVNPSLVSFNEVTGVFQNYNVAVDFDKSQGSAAFVNDTSSAPQPVANAKSCQYSFVLSNQEISDLKNLVGSLLICQGVGDGQVCTGSCPNHRIAFVSHGTQFQVNSVNLGQGSLYFCGGQDKLNAYFENLIKSNIQSSCPSDFDQLFK